MTASGRVRSSFDALVEISLTLDSQPGVAMTSSAMVLSHAKTLFRHAFGRIATDGQASSREM